MTNKKININVVPKDKIIVKFKDDKTNKVEIDDIIKVDYNGIVGVALELDKANGILSLLDKKGNVLSQVDFPTEKIITNAFYDDTTKELVIDFESANQVRIPIDFTDEIESAINEFESRVNTQFSQFKESVNTSFQEVNQKIDDLEKEINTNINSQVETLNQKVDTLEDTINNNIGKQVESLNKSIEEINNSKVDKVEGKQLSTNDLTDELLAKLNGLKNYDDTELLAKIQSIENILKSDNLDLDTLQEIANALATTNASLESVKATLNELSTNLNNNHYTKEEIELKLEEIKAIKDVEKISTENVNENVLYRTTVRGNWAGTVVPNSGTVDKVYLNTQMPVEEVVEVLKKCDLHQAYNGDIGERYTVIYKKGYGAINVNNIIPGVYTITYKGEALFTTSTSDDFYGWNPKFNGVIEWGTETMSTYEDTFGGVSTIYPVGNVNIRLTNLFSTTPITSEIIDNKLFHIKNGNAKELQNKIVAGTGIEINDKTNEISSYAIRSASEVKEITSCGWQGTVVPTSGMIESVYFNTELSIDEVVATLNKLTDVQTNEAGTISAYTLLETNSNSQTIVFMRNKGVYYLSDNLMKVVYFDSTNGWGTFDNPIAINLEATSGDYIGTQNDLLTNLFSLTPFEHTEETTEYIGNEKCIYGGGKSPVPNTGYVDKVYLNTKLTDEEILALMSKLETPNDDDGFYAGLLTGTSEETIKSVIIIKDFAIFDYFKMMMGDFSGLYWVNPLVPEATEFGFVGWKPDFDGEIVINDIAHAEMDGLTVGDQNNKLVDLFYIGGGSDNLFYLQNKQKKFIATTENLEKQIPIQDSEELPKDIPDTRGVLGDEYVDTLCFDTTKTTEEVVAVLESLTLANNGDDFIKNYYPYSSVTRDDSGNIQSVTALSINLLDKVFSTDENQWGYSIKYYSSATSQEWTIFSTKSSDGYNGWNPNFTGSIKLEGTHENVFGWGEEYRLANNKLMKDIMYTIIKGEKAKINENVLYRVEEKGGWSGTPVPNTGYVENLYFNINSSCDEVTNILKSLQFVETPFTSDPVYPIVLFSDGICFFVVDESDGLYAIYATTDITDPSLADVIFSNFEFDNKIGWHYSIDYLDINTSAVNKYSGLPIGYQNEQLSSLFSITPFVQATGKPQLYHFKDRVPYKVGLTKEDVIDIINAEFSKAEGSAF